ncbi:MAG: dTDP-4-dehydrorhamnose reductase [Rhizobiales bacterium]|nr:dTDP-4-dehydrorhamnose reductase [Hyphomicrobiales bacterium]
MILVFGRGQVGEALAEAASAAGTPLTVLSHAEADIADPAAVATAIAGHRPAFLVNAAAYTAVDKAESEPEAAARANAEGPRVLAEAAARAGIPLVHISTDYVFDGTKQGAYVEGDPVAPLGVYGATKLAGEEAVHRALPEHVILRTAWVYAKNGRNFLKTMLKLAAERPELRVVADQRGCPTSADDIAAAILRVADAAGQGRAAWGTWHFAGTGETTWHGFASRIVDEQASITGRHPPVVPIATADYPTPAKRPANSALDSSRFAEAFGFRARPWQEETRRIVHALLSKEYAS